jgi:hypothetical protein
MVLWHCLALSSAGQLTPGLLMCGFVPVVTRKHSGSESVSDSRYRVNTSYYSTGKLAQSSTTIYTL